MRSSLILSLPVAFTLASAAADWTQYQWSYMPDRTADWYKQHEKELPKLAPELAVVEEGRSYVVKLDCIGCPFRVRKFRETIETWREQDNSLLLNFTTDGSDQIFLNGEVISPLAPRPSEPNAFQIPANTSAAIFEKMVNMHMMDDETWKVGTKYGRFELQYEHTMLATKQRNEQWLQFDVTGIHIRQTHNPGSYNLEKEGQKMVQILYVREVREDVRTLIIKDVQVVDRKDRVQPLLMPCGKPAMIRTQYNPLEWDYYGKIGTYNRMWHQTTWNILHFFESNALVLILGSVILGVVSIVRRYVRRNEEKVVAQSKDDAEAALLDTEYHDSPPPQYSDSVAPGAQDHGTH